MQENVSVVVGVPVNGKLHRAGRFSLLWDDCDEDAAMLPQGVYFVRLRTPEGEQNAKLILVR